MAAIASYIANETSDPKEYVKQLAESLREPTNGGILSIEKQVLHLLLNWESKRDRTVPARVEMSKTLRKMKLEELAAHLNLASTGTYMYVPIMSTTLLIIGPPRYSELQKQTVFPSSDSLFQQGGTMEDSQ